MRVLGIDPGFGILGWAVIEKDFKLVSCGAIETEKNAVLQERILHIHHELQEILKTYRPECIALERVFFTKNTKTAIDVAKCIGVVILTIGLEGLPYAEYTPSRVKQAITGYGRADKEQVQGMIVKLFNLKSFPFPDDTADALAIAACHCLSTGNRIGKTMP